MAEADSAYTMLEGDAEEPLVASIVIEEAGGTGETTGDAGSGASADCDVRAEPSPTSAKLLAERAPRGRCCCRLLAALAVVSVLFNLALGASLKVLMSSCGESYAPVAPPEPNASKTGCPFDSGNAFVPTDAKAAVTELDADYAALCWTDFVNEQRGALSKPYAVRVADPWNDVALEDAKPLYAGRATHVNVTDLVPATTYRVAVQSPTGAQTEASFTTKDRGFCGNAADVAAQKGAKETMKRDIQQCMITNVFSENSARECISRKVGLSDDCASCWIAEGHCTIGACLTQCSSPNSDACKQCSEEKCFPTCVVCSGMPIWTFPP